MGSPNVPKLKGRGRRQLSLRSLIIGVAMAPAMIAAFNYGWQLGVFLVGSLIAGWIRVVGATHNSKGIARIGGGLVVSAFLVLASDVAGIRSVEWLRYHILRINVRCVDDQSHLDVRQATVQVIANGLTLGEKRLSTEGTIDTEVQIGGSDFKSGLGIIFPSKSHLPDLNRISIRVDANGYRSSELRLSTIESLITNNELIVIKLSRHHR